MENNNIISRNNFLSALPVAVLTIIATTLSWKHYSVHFLYPIVAIALFLFAQQRFAHKNYIFYAIALCIPLTTIIIKRQVASIEQDQNLFQKTVFVEGKVLDVRHSFDKKISTFCTIETDTITHENNQYILKKRVHLFIPARTRIKSQQKIFLNEVVIKAPPEGSYKTFCQQESIWGTVYATQKNYTLQHTAASKKISIFEKISRSFSLKTKILFDLVFLGKKDAGYISQTIQHQSLYWGVSHIIARSGLHLSIIFLLIFCMLISLPIPYRYKLIITLIFIIWFFISTPYSTSFNRAFLMITTYLLSQIHKVLHKGLHLLTTLTLFILLYNPLTCLSLGFQLSFGITYIIIKALSNNTKRNYCFKK